MTDRDYMRRAIELAKGGLGGVNPNPLVGAVIVKDGRIIGEGFHQKYGELHAERNAIAALTESAEGATLYVTLEPCCHYGKTPPCTEAILEQKISRVVIGSRDPNPKVAGKGAAILRAAGVRVEEDFLREECDELNPVFFHYITTKTPYVVMKYAMTADGKIATKTGASKWITGEEARGLVQELRRRYMGIMAGIGTVLADDPLLNVRVEGWRSPVRIICDSRLRIPPDSQICRTAGAFRTIVAHACAEQAEGGHAGAAGEQAKAAGSHAGAVDEQVEAAGGQAGAADEQAEAVGGQSETAAKQEALRSLGVELISVPGADGHVDLKRLMEILGEMGIDSILLEGGGTLNDSALRAGIVKEVKAFVAPKLFGGTGGKTPVEGTGVEFPSEAFPLTLHKISRVGEDLLLEYQTGQVKTCLQES